MKLIARFLISALALLIVSEFIPGIEVESLYIALITAFILGVLNVIVKPILVLLTLPISIVTLGLFIFVINGALFWFTASFIDGFTVGNFWLAILGALLVSVISTVGNWFIK